jgi:hypothetical protein
MWSIGSPLSDRGGANGRSLLETLFFRKSVIREHRLPHLTENVKYLNEKQGKSPFPESPLTALGRFPFQP